jgi:hypothetical protein
MAEKVQIGGYQNTRIPTKNVPYFFLPKKSVDYGNVRFFLAVLQSRSRIILVETEQDPSRDAPHFV